MKTTITILVASCLLFQSCSKDTPSDAEVMSNKLTNVVEDFQISRVICFEGTANFNNTSIIGNAGANFKFDKQFVTVNGRAWNLQFLRGYEVRTITNINYLGLYF